MIWELTELYYIQSTVKKSPYSFNTGQKAVFSEMWHTTTNIKKKEHHSRKYKAQIKSLKGLDWESWTRLNKMPQAFSPVVS